MSEATGEYPGSEEMLRRYPEYKLYVRGAGILPEEIYGRVRPDIAGTTLFRLILDVKTGNYLKKNNISTIEDLAAIEQRILARALGDEEVRTVTDKIKDLTRRLALFSPEDHLMSEVLEPKMF